jgi:hypothetical protein
MHSKIPEIDFWNGNRSEIRQQYERHILDAVLKATNDDFGACRIVESRINYPGNEESLAFTEKQHDILVTVAGNQKFDSNEVIIVPKPLIKNLLGYRIPIVKQDFDDAFLQNYLANKIKDLTHGIPETWSDADILRHNDYSVVEEGDFDDVFDRLADGRFDYTTFGANEVISIFKTCVHQKHKLKINKDVLFFYPLPLVFYVHTKQKHLAKRVALGMQCIEENGELNQIFNRYYTDVVDELNLQGRKLLVLENPYLPKSFPEILPTLTFR